jgi:hypothetical protein
VPNHSIILQLHVAHHTLTTGGSSLLFIFGGGEKLHAFVRMEESNEVIPFVYMYRRLVTMIASCFLLDSGLFFLFLKDGLRSVPRNSVDFADAENV